MTDLRLSTDRLGFALHQARRGRRVVVLMAQAREIRPVLAWLERHLDDRGTERVHWANGFEAYRRTDSSGCVELTSPTHFPRTYRGQHADLLLVGPGVMMTADIEEAAALLLRNADPVAVDTDPGSPPILLEDS